MEQERRPTKTMVRSPVLQLPFNLISPARKHIDDCVTVLSRTHTNTPVQTELMASRKGTKGKEEDRVSQLDQIIHPISCELKRVALRAPDSENTLWLPCLPQICLEYNIHLSSNCRKNQIDTCAPKMPLLVRTPFAKFRAGDDGEKMGYGR